MKKIAIALLILQAMGVLALGWRGGKETLEYFFTQTPPVEWGGFFAYNGVIALPGFTYWFSLIPASFLVSITLAMLVQDRRLEPLKPISFLGLVGWLSTISLGGVLIARVSHLIMIPVFLISFLGVLVFWISWGIGWGSRPLRKQRNEAPHRNLSPFVLKLSVFTLVEVVIMARFSEFFTLWSIGGS